MLNPTPFQDADGIAVNKSYAQKHNLRTIDDLKKVGSFTYGGPPENANLALTIHRVDGRPLPRPVVFDYWDWDTAHGGTPPAAGPIRLLAAETVGHAANPDDPNRVLDLLPGQDPSRIERQARSMPPFYTSLAVYGPAKSAELATQPGSATRPH